jgi:NADPH:quinone reductase-like Zn-dependent oxidoreductase
MKAVRFHAYGDASVLEYEDAPMPVVAADDVLIKVHAAGVNPADWQFRYGYYKDFAPRKLPFIPGWDVAGTVERVGGAVRRFTPGDCVFAMADMSRDGAYAEHMAVRASEVAGAPRTLPLEQAAGVPLAALTAWKALFDDGKLESGQTVLIHAAAGGVGQFAVQLAHRAGARVIGTASATNLDLVRSLGADQAIDYRSRDFTTEVGELDLIVDGVGGESRAKSWGVLRKGGTLAAVAMPPPDEAIARRHGVRSVMVAVQPDGARLEEIRALIDAGELRVIIDREFPLEQAAAAHRYSEARHARGKIVLRVN